MLVSIVAEVRHGYVSISAQEVDLFGSEMQAMIAATSVGSSQKSEKARTFAFEKVSALRKDVANPTHKVRNASGGRGVVSRNLNAIRREPQWLDAGSGMQYGCLSFKQQFRSAPYQTATKGLPSMILAKSISTQDDLSCARWPGVYLLTVSTPTTNGP